MASGKQDTFKIRKSTLRKVGFLRAHTHTHQLSYISVIRKMERKRYRMSFEMHEKVFLKISSSLIFI